MSGRRFSRADIPQSIPTLLGPATVAVVVAPHPHTSLDPLWEIVRAAAAERRVVLIDLCLVSPRLVEPGPAGITDAFLAGVSLNDIVRAIGPDLYLIGAGAPIENPEHVWTHERWTRLARGFRQEAALMVLFTPAEALGKLPVDVDVVIALTAEDVAGAADAGMALDRMLALEPHMTRWPASLPPPPPKRVRRSFIGRLSKPRGRMGSVMRERERLGSAVAIAAVVTVAIGLGAAALVYWPRGGAPATAANPPGSTTTPVATPADSLYYSVQVAAFQDLTQAESQARAHEQAGFTAIVTPVRLGRQGVWYRLLIGTAATPRAAQLALTAAWDRRVVERPNGTILRTPLTLRVGRYPDRAQAIGAGRALRREGIGGYIVETPGGAQLLVGAFESPEQAALADSILVAIGRPGTLVNRVGIAR